jgi:hypothetical protein
MQLKIHPVIRFIIGAGIFLLYMLCLIHWQLFDGIIRSFVPGVYLIAAVLGAAMCAIFYALLPTKKTIDITKKALQSGGKNDRVVGYWLWLLCGAIFFVIWLPFYINEM